MRNGHLISLYRIRICNWRLTLALAPKELSDILAIKIIALINANAYLDLNEVKLLNETMDK